MASFSFDFREQIQAALQELIVQSESSYLKIGHDFPRLLKEMDLGLAGSSEITTALKGENGCGETTARECLKRAITDVRELIQDASTGFGEMRTKDQESFAQLHDALERLKSLDSNIHEIKEDSIEMEIISINAMTASIKAGTAGKAFSFITEELKRLAERTIALSEEINERGRHLRSVFEAYRSNMEQSALKQEAVFSTAGDRLEESFSSLQTGIGQVVTQLGDISAGSTAVRKPLQRIMEEVQLHDIIKQSIDHVLISLRELTDITTLTSDEAALDELTFFMQLPDLCNDILTDVRAKLLESVSVFRQESHRATQIIENTEKERSAYVHRFLDQNSRDEGSVQHLYDLALRRLQHLVEDLEASLSEKRRVAERSKVLTKDVLRLSEGFRTFRVLLNRFRSVDIHSRIEVAKQSVLQNMSSTVDEMTTLISRIEADVQNGVDTTSSFMGVAEKVLGDFGEILTEESHMVHVFASRIRVCYERFQDARRLLMQSVSDYEVFTNDFLSLFEESKRDYTKLESLAEEIERVRSSLLSIRDQAASERKRILQRNGLVEWHIESERLQSIIERFTIFTHKETAGKLAGLEIEEGIGSGDITFF